MKKLLFFIIFTVCIIQISSACEAKDLDLLNVNELRNKMSKWIIVDARPLNYWKKSHIPGSVSLSWENYTETDENQVPYRILSPEKMAQALGNLGISDKSDVVVYGDADESWGGEGWVCWMLSWIGHKGEVRLLEGGIQAWKRNSFTLVTSEHITGKDQKNTQTDSNPKNSSLITDTNNRITESISYIPHPESWMNITAREIHEHADSYLLVDTRSTFEWLKGHLPGAVHIPWEKFFKGKDRTPLNAEELKRLLIKNGIDIKTVNGNRLNGEKQEKISSGEASSIKERAPMEKIVVYYCTGGIRSGYSWMVHSLAGLPEALNFEGGVAEWDKVYP